MTVISLSLRNDGGGLPFRDEGAFRNENHFAGTDSHFERKMDLLWIDCGFIRRGSRFDMRGEALSFRNEDRWPSFQKEIGFVLDLDWIYGIPFDMIAASRFDMTGTLPSEVRLSSA